MSSELGVVGATDNTTAFTLLALMWGASMFISYVVVRRKGYAGTLGLLLGLLMWIGVLIALLLRDQRPPQLDGSELLYRECPSCREDMRVDASVCPHCQRESQAWLLAEED